MENIFVEFLPPWVETGLQPAFYDKESGTVLQQTARMYNRVNMLIRMFNKLSKNTKEEVERFEGVVNDEIEQFEHDVNETVDEYIEKFTALKDFVDDYFENLDVQEEINNKLDDMLDAGTLQEIIIQYIQSTALWMFDTVADMKLATNLVNGSYTCTLGFYTKNDKGGATYRIRTKTGADTIDEMTLLSIYDNTLVAELVTESEMNVKQFGAKGDGTNDDTSAIQCALDNCKNITVPDGTYMVDAETNINLNTGNRLMLNENAKIKAITNSATGYKIINITDVNNVELCGGTIEGDRDSHTGDTGEYGHCINIMGDCDNIYIHDINVTKAWGDGIYFHSTGTVYTSRVHVDNPRRNGYSIITAGKLISNDDIIENVGGATGTAPKDGIDIEPNLDTESVYAIFNNLYTKNNSSVGFAINHHVNNSTPNYIELNNYKSDGDSRGLSLMTGENSKGNVVVNNCYVTNSTHSNGAIIITAMNNKHSVLLNHPYIENYLTEGASHGGLVVGGHTDYNAGNIRIIEPIVIKPINAEGSSPNISAIRTGTITNGSYNNLEIINPIDLDGKSITLNGTYGENCVVRDDYNQSTNSIDGNLSIGAGLYYSLVDSSQYTANRTVTIKDTTTIPVGCSIKFQNTGDYNMSVKFENQYIYPLSNSAGSTAVLSTKGSTMTINRISSTEWIATSITGTVTI